MNIEEVIKENKKIKAELVMQYAPLTSRSHESLICTPMVQDCDLHLHPFAHAPIMNLLSMLPASPSFLGQYRSCILMNNRYIALNSLGLRHLAPLAPHSQRHPHVAGGSPVRHH